MYKTDDGYRHWLWRVVDDDDGWLLYQPNGEYVGTCSTLAEAKRYIDSNRAEYDGKLAANAKPFTVLMEDQQ